MKQLKEYTDGRWLMSKAEWIEWIMMRNCVSRYKAQKIFQSWINEEKLIEF